jgi:uncharacterized protein YggU (UPF0235/DUF167 family)
LLLAVAQASRQLLAEALQVPRAAVTLVAGPASRSKVVQVAGLAPDDVARRLGVPLP